jgi:hypothetical protein
MVVLQADADLRAWASTRMGAGRGVAPEPSS